MGPDYPDPQTNAGTFAFNPDNSDEAQATGLLAYRNAWDPGPFTAVVEEAVIEGDNDKRRAMYEQLQRDFQATAPFVIMFQKTEQSGRQAKVQNFTIGGPVTAAAYWPVSK